MFLGKKGMMKYISHLDMMRLFQRAARRAGLPLYLTQGFNPHPRIKIEPALKLGVEGKDLRAEIILRENLAADKVKSALESELPEGICIRNVTRS